MSNELLLTPSHFDGAKYDYVINNIFNIISMFRYCLLFSIVSFFFF